MGNLFAASTLIIGAAYTLWMYKRVFYSEVVHDSVAKLKDIRGSVVIVFILLAIPIFWIGLYPNPLLNIFHASIAHLLKLSMVSKLG